MRAPTLADEACSKPPEGAQFAAVRGPDDDPVPIGDPDDDDYGDDEEDDEEDDGDGDYDDE